MTGITDRFKLVIDAQHRRMMSLVVVVLVGLATACGASAQSATSTDTEPSSTKPQDQAIEQTAPSNTAISTKRYQAAESPFSFSYTDDPSWIIREHSFARLSASDGASEDSAPMVDPIGVSLHFGDEVTTENEVFSVVADPPGEQMVTDGLLERWEQLSAEPSGPIVEEVELAGHPAVRASFPPAEYRGEAIAYLVTTPSRTYMIRVIRVDSGESTDLIYQRALGILDTLELD